MTEIDNEEIVVRRPTWREDDLAILCGIANAGGGRLVMTLPANNSSRKMRRVRKTFELIPRLAQTNLGISCFAEPVMDGTELCLEIVVPPASTPVCYGNTYYLYTNGENTVVDEGLLTSLFEGGENSSWETRIQPFIRQEDLDAETIARMVEALGHAGAMPGHSDISADRTTSEALISYDMKDAHTDAYTNIGVLLLHRAPQNYIPGAFVRIGLFDEQGQEMIAPETITGPLTSQHKQAIELLYEKFLPQAAELQRTESNETQEIILPPEQAVSEAILNALVHKDYDSALPIRISVTPHSLHIDNVGRPPAGWTTEDLSERHNSRPNNPALTNALNLEGVFGGWGNGFASMIRSCQQAGVPQPTVVLRADETEVTFPICSTAETQPAQAQIEHDRLATPAVHSGEDASASTDQTIPNSVDPDGKYEQDQTPTHQADKTRSDDQIGIDSSEGPGISQQPTADIKDVAYTNEPTKAPTENTKPRYVKPKPPQNRKSTFKDHSIAAANRLNMTSTDEYILKVIETNGRVTAIRIAEVLGVSESTVRRSFRRLREYGFIERIGSDKAGYWRIID